MKKCKSLLAFFLILVLMFSLSVSAFADEGEFKYQATKDYVESLKRLPGTSCEPHEFVTLGGKEFEVLDVHYTGGKLSSLEFGFLAAICEDGSEMILTLCLLEYDIDKLAEVREAVNQFNAETTGVKVYADSGDDTINADVYILADPAAPDLGARGTANLIALVDKMVEDFAGFAK